MKNIEESGVSESDRIIITREEIVFRWMLCLKREANRKSRIDRNRRCKTRRMITRVYVLETTDANAWWSVVRVFRWNRNRVVAALRNKINKRRFDSRRTFCRTGIELWFICLSQRQTEQTLWHNIALIYYSVIPCGISAFHLHTRILFQLYFARTMRNNESWRFCV